MTKLLSEGLLYHIKNNLPIRESVYRPGSLMFFNMIVEAKQAYKQNLFEADEIDHDLLISDIGEYGKYAQKTVPLDYPIPEELDMFEDLDEKRKRKKSKKKKSGSYYKNKKVKLNKPKRNSGSGGKFVVYVRNPDTGNIKRITFGARGMSVGLKSLKRRKSFVARHRCTEKKDKTKPGYWACRVGRYPELFGGSKSYTWW
jgi:hypothetical protein